MKQPRLNLFEERQVLSVSQLVNDLRTDLEMRYRNLWIQGEISNLRKYPSGHFYFTLKDKKGQISAVCFRLQAQALRFRPEDGMDVIARGSVSVYPARGQLQFIVETIEPMGRGALQAAFEQLKAKLKKEGLFETARKKQLPMLPSKIGIVTSPKGAAIQDILRVLKRRHPRLNILISPARVQGSDAAKEIASGIQTLDERPDIDVIIVTRGGGSLEDLWAFNEEPVARAIFAARKPIISAVGHEIDFTISDFVADLRAPTPSAAAEIVSSAQEELTGAVQNLQRRSIQATRLILNQKRQRLLNLTASRAFGDAESRLKLYAQKLDELHGRLLSIPPGLLQPLNQQLEQAGKNTVAQMRLILERRRQTATALEKQLHAFSPLEVLQRGYAIVTTQENEVVRQPAQVSEGGRFHVRVAGGTFRGRKDKEDGV